jgi:hypothetical protein
MSAQLDDPLTADLRDALSNLAAGLFGLDAWVKETDKYLPPNQNLPWRAAGHTFAPADLAVIPFFENLLRESAGDDDLGVRWTAVAADPLKYSPLPNAAAWRKNRGLADPKFGIVASNNVWLTDAAGKVVSRATFYAPCWPLLQAVIAARQTAGPVDWAALARDLLANAAPQWPATSQPPSAAFIIQFTSDMLYAMLGMRNQAPEGWQRAVLVELGEYRHPGNEYSREDTAAAVKAFEKLASL